MNAMSTFSLFAPDPLKILSVWPEQLAQRFDDVSHSLKGSIMFDNCRELAEVGPKLQPNRYHILILPTSLWPQIHSRQKTLFQTRVQLFIFTPLAKEAAVGEEWGTLTVSYLTWEKQLSTTAQCEFLFQLFKQLSESHEIQVALEEAFPCAFSASSELNLKLTRPNGDIWPQKNHSPRPVKKPPQPAERHPPSTGPVLQISDSTIGNVIQSPGEVNIYQNSPEETASARFSNLTNNQQNMLFQTLVDFFSLEDLQTLCFQLQIDFDELSGQKKSSKARELLIQVDHRNQIKLLVNLIKESRPHVPLDLSDFQT